MKRFLRAVPLLVVMLLWGLHLAYPMNRLQHVRWAFGGHPVPVYYVLTVLLMAGASVLALIFKRDWSRWELLWWALPLICLPGILHSTDPIWSLRQWLSWIIRGIVPGGIIFLAAHRKRSEGMLLFWIYPIIIGASLLGLWELYYNQKPPWDRYALHQRIDEVGALVEYIPIAQTSQSDNPFYRPADEMRLSGKPLGTQGNRIPYAVTLIGFLPLGVWLLRYKRSSRLVHLFAFGALCSILLLAQVRAVWVGALVAIVLMQTVGLLGDWRGTIKIVAGVSLCLGVFLVFPKTRDVVWSRFDSFHLAEGSIQERLAVLETAKVLGDRGFLGVGFGEFPAACKSYYHSALPWRGTPDNQYLRWMIENGLPSFVLLASFFIGLLRAGWERIKLMVDIQRADFYRALLVGWASVAVTFLFFDGFYWGACNMTFWCLLGLFATCLKSPESSAL
ncbi:MAG: O-antigen ligase family protein [Elusimicrobiota bacterium]